MRTLFSTDHNTTPTSHYQPKEKEFKLLPLLMLPMASAYNAAKPAAAILILPNITQNQILVCYMQELFFLVKYLRKMCTGFGSTQ
jgi:hypothetical protein